MPGLYTSVWNAPQGQHLTLATDPAHLGGGPIPLDFAGFEEVPMNRRVGGRVADAARRGIQGFRTHLVTFCIAVAAMQRQEPNGSWTHYFFAHLNGGEWTEEDARLFNENITDPRNAYIALYSSQNPADFMRDFDLERINEINVAHGGVAIPQDHALGYKGCTANFALRLVNSGIGEVIPEVAPPTQKGMVVTGTANVEFDFSADTTSTQTIQKTLNPPAHTETATIALTGSDVRYTDDEQYGFGKFQVELSALSEQSVQAMVTLRDDNINKREWAGRVRATVMFFKSPDERGLSIRRPSDSQTG